MVLPAHIVHDKLFYVLQYAIDDRHYDNNNNNNNNNNDKNDKCWMISCCSCLPTFAARVPLREPSDFKAKPAAVPGSPDMRVKYYH
eukprot:1161661-Pelagomonas_calceolata.AAC.8